MPKADHKAVQHIHNCSGSTSKPRGVWTSALIFPQCNPGCLSVPVHLLWVTVKPELTRVAAWTGRAHTTCSVLPPSPAWPIAAASLWQGDRPLHQDTKLTTVIQTRRLTSFFLGLRIKVTKKKKKESKWQESYESQAGGAFVIWLVRKASSRIWTNFPGCSIVCAFSYKIQLNYRGTLWLQANAGGRVERLLGPTSRVWFTRSRVGHETAFAPGPGTTLWEPMLIYADFLSTSSQSRTHSYFFNIKSH